MRSSEIDPESRLNGAVILPVRPRMSPRSWRPSSAVRRELWRPTRSFPVEAATHGSGIG
jgi:hypothetical protein